MATDEQNKNNIINKLCKIHFNFVFEGRYE